MDFDGPTRMNIVGNYAREGPSASSATRIREMWVYHSIGEPPFSYFVRDNLGPRRPSPSALETAILYCREHQDGVPNSGVDCDPTPLATATSFAAPPVTTASAAAAYDDVLENAGATLPRRDLVDLRVVDQVRRGTGGSVSHPAEVGGWPWMASAPPPYDGDHDGMPDLWEFQHGFDFDTASNGALDADGDGYTNVEEFLNGTHPLSADR
jgi:hypothetical protein